MEKMNKKQLKKASGGWTADVTKGNLDNIKAGDKENIKVTPYACLAGKCADVETT